MCRVIGHLNWPCAGEPLDRGSLLIRLSNLCSTQTLGKWTFVFKTRAICIVCTLFISTDSLERLQKISVAPAKMPNCIKFRRGSCSVYVITTARRIVCEENVQMWHKTWRSKCVGCAYFLKGTEFFAGESVMFSQKSTLQHKLCAISFWKLHWNTQSGAD